MELSGPAQFEITVQLLKCPRNVRCEVTLYCEPTLGDTHLRESELHCAELPHVLVLSFLEPMGGPLRHMHRTASDLYKQLDGCKVGDEVEVEVLRHTSKEQVKILLEASS